MLPLLWRRLHRRRQPHPVLCLLLCQSQRFADLWCFGLFRKSRTRLSQLRCLLQAWSALFELWLLRTKLRLSRVLLVQPASPATLYRCDGRLSLFRRSTGCHYGRRAYTLPVHWMLQDSSGCQGRGHGALKTGFKSKNWEGCFPIGTASSTRGRYVCVLLM